MNPFKIEELPYPMFVTNDDEKEILKELLEVLKSTANREFFLCLLLGEYFEENEFAGIKAKINRSLGTAIGLGSYLGLLCNLNLSGHYAPKELRINWINKLLTYTGE